MATALENAILARDAAMNNLVQLEQAGPMKFGVTYSIDGRSFDWIGAKRFYTEQVDNLTNLIQKLEGAWIVRSRGV